MTNVLNPVLYRGDDSVLLPKSRNNIILIHPILMKQLQFKKGSLLLIKCFNGQILLKSWPCQLLDESTAALPEFSLFKHFTTSQFHVTLFEGCVFQAESVVFSPTEHKTFMDSKAFKKFLQKTFNYLYVREGMILHLKYLGYPCCFTIKKVSNVEENNLMLIDELKNREDLHASLPYVNDDLNDSATLDESFNKKCVISKSFRSENQFQSSTPYSSPKVSSQTEPSMPDFKLCLDLEALSANPVPEKFYRIHIKTKIRIENVKCLEQLRSTTFEDIVGLDEQITEIKSSIKSILNSGSYSASRGILIIGPSGTGKTMIAEALPNEYKYELFICSVNKDMLRIKGSSIVELKRIFKEVEDNSPSVLFLDDVDQIYRSEELINAPKNEQILASEISSMIHHLLNSVPDVLVIATSQNESSVFENLQKHGILEKKIQFPIPSSSERKQIFTKILRKWENNLTVNEVSEISEMAHGFTGGDLRRLCLKAETRSRKEGIKKTSISFLDLKNSFKFIKPTSMSEFRFEVPNVKWSDIGGMEEVKNAVTEMINWPLEFPEKFKRFNIVPPRGILMYGPPGCCKTMIAKALAAESQLNFINVKGAEIFSKYVGDSEKSVSELFKKARAAAPCVLFIDEIDSLTSKRGSSKGNSNVEERVLTQILIELDGIDVLQEGVSVIAATNRPDRIDPSLLRPGRLDRLIYVPLPDACTRKEIFQVTLRKKPLSSDFDLNYLVDRTENYTGAEISGICKKACMQAIKESTSNTSVLCMRHFLMALTSTKPRTSQEMIEIFENYRNSKMFYKLL